MTIILDRRFRGPAGSGNGGYTCGRVAAFLDGDVEVTLRLPPPLERSLDVDRNDGAVDLRDGEGVVAEATSAKVDLELPPPVPYAAAEGAALPHGDPASPFPECFVCGRDRPPGDGLRIFAGPLEGTALVAAPWRPEASMCTPELVWAALDCPGAYGCGAVGRGHAVLGRLAAHVERVPAPRERCVVAGWSLGEDGRKLYAGTVLWGDADDVIGYARATWILPRP